MTFEAVRLAADWAVYKVEYAGIEDRTKRTLLVSGLTQYEAMMLASQLRVEQALTSR